MIDRIGTSVIVRATICSTMDTLRTYRKFRFFAAVLLAFGTVLPFADYVCAMSGERTAMSPALVSRSVSGTAFVPEHVLGVLCADMACCQGSMCTEVCEESCSLEDNVTSHACGNCITETALDEDATVPTRIGLAQFPILLEFFLPAESGIVSSVSKPVSPPRESPARPGLTPPHRVLYACFLL